MNSLDEAKLKNLFKDKGLTDALHLAIQRAFFKKQKERDVHFLAAKTLAVELLDEVWSELERLNKVENDTKNQNLNVGL